MKKRVPKYLLFLHIRISEQTQNFNFTHTLMGSELMINKQEKDLGVVMHCEMNISVQKLQTALESSLYLYDLMPPFLFG